MGCLESRTQDEGLEFTRENDEGSADNNSNSDNRSDYVAD